MIENTTVDDAPCKPMVTMKPRHRRLPTVHYPAEIEEKKYVGPLYGYYHPESNEYNVVSCENAAGSLLLIGCIADADVATTNNQLVGKWEADQLIFYQAKQRCQKIPYQLLLNVFSRNSGILETDQMLRKRVIISGLGSVGSLVALELARAGVGGFMLVDNDTLAYHNLCRHQCGIESVGRFKVSAMRDMIQRINPHAEVTIVPHILEEVSKAQFDGFIDKETLVVGCADNREGDLYANHISILYDVPFVSIGFWERAFAGEIFYSIPGKTPCYECVFGRGTPEVSKRSSENHRYYTEKEDLAQTRFVPGISTDINFITTVGIKLVLDLLNMNVDSYIPRLLDSLSQFTILCNTNKTQIAGEMVDIFSYPLQISTSINIDYDRSCKECKLLRSRSRNDRKHIPGN